MSESAVLERKKTFDTYSTVVDEIEVLSPRNKRLHFRLLGGKTMDYKPGQFVQVMVPLPNGKIERTAYSISSAPKSNNEFELCVTLVPGGTSSTFLHSLKEGAEVGVVGPFGQFILPKNIERDLVFIATGSGIAPFRSMIQQLVSENFNRSIYLIYGNRYDDDILYKPEWDEISAQHKNFKVIHTLSRPSEKWTGNKGYVQDCLPGALLSVLEKDFYICGLNKMIVDVQNKLISLNVSKDRIHYERYD